MYMRIDDDRLACQQHLRSWQCNLLGSGAVAAAGRSRYGRPEPQCRGLHTGAAHKDARKKRAEEKKKKDEEREKKHDPFRFDPWGQY